jgi:hypothetical protein
MKLHVNNEDIERVEHFTYWGREVSADGGAIEDVNTRIKKANGTFVQLYPLRKSKNISRKTKIHIFSSNVKPVLLYGCETWKVTTQITNKLLAFVNRCLRIILGIRWPEVVCNVELWEATAEKPGASQIKKRKWWWIGHTLRKNGGSKEKQALDWNPQGVRREVRLKQTWKNVRHGARCFTDAPCT